MKLYHRVKLFLAKRTGKVSNVSIKDADPDVIPTVTDENPRGPSNTDLFVYIDEKMKDLEYEFEHEEDEVLSTAINDEYKKLERIKEILSVKQRS